MANPTRLSASMALLLGLQVHLPGQALPGQALPGQALPGQALPGQALPGQALPGQDLRAALPADCVLTVGAADPVAAVVALERAVGGLPADLPADVSGLVGAGLLAMRVHFGGSLTAFVERMAAGGAAFGIARRKTRWVPYLVLRPGDPAAAIKYLDGRGGGVCHETHEDVLLVSASVRGCERLLQQWQQREEQTAAPPAADLVRAHVDLEALWRAIPGPDVESLDGGGRFFLAPLTSVLAGATDLFVRLQADERVRVEARIESTVHGGAWAGLLAAAGAARDCMPMPDGGILQVAIDRSFGALLRRPEQFLDEGDQLGIQGFLSIADLIDGATTSFVDDLVGGLVEPFVFTVLEAEAVEGESEHCPIRVPGLALSAAIADPKVTTLLRRAAGVLATIVNGERAQNGKKPFVLRTAWSEHGAGIAAEPPLWRGPGLPPMEDALSPTLLFGHGHVVLASTHAAADRLLATLAERGPESFRGDRVRLCGATLAQAIVDNRSPLELQRMLDEGESQAQVTRFFDIATAVAGAIGRVDLSADYGAAVTTITLELERRR